MKGSGRAKAVVADCWPDGTIRGVLDPGARRCPGLDRRPRACFQVMRSNATGQPYIGHLPLVEGGIQVQVEHYLQSSEQIQASLTLWCDPGTGEAGGLLVEPLPDCPPDRLARLVQAIEGLEVVPFWERTPEFLATWVSQGEGADDLAATELFYRCRCTREALLETLRRFPEEQKADLFQEPGPLEVRCDYCGTLYPITRDDLLPGRPDGRPHRHRRAGPAPGLAPVRVAELPRGALPGGGPHQALVLHPAGAPRRASRPWRTWWPGTERFILAFWHRRLFMMPLAYPFHAGRRERAAWPSFPATARTASAAPPPGAGSASTPCAAPPATMAPRPWCA